MIIEKITERNDELKKNIIRRLNRIEGQIKGINGMIQKDIYCDDVLIQISAAQSALNSVSKIILENHIRGCVVDKIHNKQDEVVDELIKTIGRML